MKRLNTILLTLAALLVSTASSFSMDEERLSPMFLNDSAAADVDSLVSIVVFLDNEDGREVVRRASARPMNRVERLKFVTRQLQDAQPIQAGAIRRRLEQLSVEPVELYWIAPAYSATVHRRDVDIVASLDGVRLVVPDITLDYIEPVERGAGRATAAAVSSELQLLRVPEMWAQGYTGHGRLVCSFDTGVESSHPALASKWRGRNASIGESWYSPLTPNSPPTDQVGHGTHTMGIMVGSVVGDTFGVAPEAEWITAGVVDQGRSFATTISDILGAFQWVLDPDGNPATTDDVPDVILNSWGVPTSLWPACDQTFWQVIDNVEAAGIVTIFAAGNEGPDPQTLRIPADRATSPVNSFCVGAIGLDQVIADFSSRGPSPCNTSEFKPEVVAPGRYIRSSIKGGGYGTMSGTSMAAPFIAGLVALCRQYNPDATVEEIKYALINSCRDLGPAGDDNAYGHGVVDASKLVNLLPIPTKPNFSLVSSAVVSGSVALPGESFSLRVTLSNSVGNVESAVGYLVSLDPSAAVIEQGEATFSFGSGGTTAVASPEYQALLSADLPHGSLVPMRLRLENGYGVAYDSIDFEVLVGIAPPGATVDQDLGNLALTVSDFAQFGFAGGSIYNLDGRGFRFHDGGNLLYEAGLIIGRSSLQVSSAVRGDDGEFRISDFVPVTALSSGWRDNSDQRHLKAAFRDDRAAVSIPVLVDQQTISFSSPEQSGFILFNYNLVNIDVSPVTGLRFGFFADFDLADSESFGYDEGINLLYQQGENSTYVGLIGLKNINIFTTGFNGSDKRGFTRSELFALINSTAQHIDTAAGDGFFVASAGPFSLASDDSAEVAFALVAGDDLGELYANATQAMVQYGLVTGIDDSWFNVPSSFVLHNNYPNPFNPTTTISFTLPTAADVRLDIYNTLGQRVTTLCSGHLRSGRHDFEWDATTSSGDQVASGVYFYRLTSGDSSKSRKMVLLR